MIVGADAHIGSRGSIEFAEDYRKPGTSCGWTESSTPTKYGESKTGGVGADDSVGPENIADSLQVSVKSVHPAGRSEPRPYRLHPLYRKDVSRTMQFLKCACYLAGLGVLSFVLGRLVPKAWFDYTRFPYRAFAFERDGKVYEALGIAHWQSRVPDMSRLFPKLMPPKKLSARPDELMLAGLGVIFIWPCAWGILLYLVYAIFGNLIFILIQRYNRPRLVRLYERQRAKRSKEA